MTEKGKIGVELLEAVAESFSTAKSLDGLYMYIKGGLLMLYNLNLISKEEHQELSRKYLREYYIALGVIVGG